MLHPELKPDSPAAQIFAASASKQAREAQIDIMVAAIGAWQKAINSDATDKYLPIEYV